MCEELTKSFTSKIIELQDNNGYWNVLTVGDKYYPEYNYYVPNYNSTLWTLVLLADIQCNISINKLKKPLKTIFDHFLDIKLNIYTLGKSHFPMPCLNGNMLYLHSYFKLEDDSIVSDIVDFFAKYQRFDDGDYQTSSSFPYCSNRSCYGNHTCYWGVVKLLKGLTFIPINKRSENAINLIKNCTDFILLHDICFSSHDNTKFLHTNIMKLSFPNMYQSDFLEILWLLKKENVKSTHIEKALDLLKSKMKPDGIWKIERRIKNLIVPIGNQNKGYEFTTERAVEVLDYYGKI